MNLKVLITFLVVLFAIVTADKSEPADTSETESKFYLFPFQKENLSFFLF